MNPKVTSAILILLLTLSIMFTTAPVGAPLPNPNQIIYATFGFPETVDPAWAYDTASSELIQNIYEPLWMYNGTSTDVFIPMLGETWPGCGDPLYPGYPAQAGNSITPLPPHPDAPGGTDQTWYVKIRKNVPWQDYATYGNLTPYDVEYTIERGMMMDHTGGPQWMMYQPLLNCTGSKDYGDVANNITEYNVLAYDVAHAVEANSTHVWFNLRIPFAPFQQILCHTCGMIMCKQWCINHGLWNGTYVRTWVNPSGSSSGWLYRKLITINHTKVAGDLTDFPVLIDTTDADLISKTQTDGDDIVFVDASINKLDYEIELFNVTTGRLVAWVKVPNLSSTTDTKLYMYYGNSHAANQQNTAGVWDPNFKMVHHLKESTGKRKDSTSNHNDGTPEGGLKYNATGKIDGAAEFNSTASMDIRIADSDSIDFTGPQTLEAWIKANSTHNDVMTIADNSALVGSNITVGAAITNSGQFVYRRGNLTRWWFGFSASDVADEKWHYIVGVDNGTGFKVYVDGVKEYDQTPTGYSSPSKVVNDLWVGSINGTQVFFNGTMDEIRISNISRSDAWVSTCYTNQKDPSSFYTSGSEEENHFLRCYDPPPPGPLMLQPDAPGPVVPGPVAMGTGPYKLYSIDPDPRTGFYTLQKFDAYWQGWPAPKHWYNTTVTNSYCGLVTMKCVEEWSNRRVQFLSTDPALQCDFTNIPRANVPEMHLGGNKDGPTYRGFRMETVPVQSIGALFFNYNVTQPSDWTPRLGPDLNQTLLSDRDLRLAFMYCMNFTQYMAEYWLSEASVPATCLPPGTAYYNASKPTRNIDLVKAQQRLIAAWGGQVYNKGITIPMIYVLGDKAGEVAKMLEDVIENKISWPTGAAVDIIPTPLPRSVFESEMNSGKLSIFITNRMADFPHPHDWFMPFMHSQGYYAGVAQSVQYGLNPASMEATYVEGGLRAPPYTNALGESVTWTGTAGSWKINNTYVDHLITAAAGAPGGPGSIAEKLYNELQDIYYAEALSMPLYFSYDRHYERTWVRGWLGTYNENPICPGHYFYLQWKAILGTLFNVDVTAVSISNVTRTPRVVQAFRGEIRDGLGLPSRINYSMQWSWPESSGPPFIEVLVTLQRTDQDGNIFFRRSYLQFMAPQDSITVPLWIWSENGLDERWDPVTGYPKPGYTGVLPPGNLTEPSAGNWTTSLYVSPSGVDGGTVTDSNYANNKVDSPYVVHAWTWAVDIDGSGICNMVDVGTAARAFGTDPGETRWNPYSDINGDGTVNMEDIGTIARNFGKTFFDVFGPQYY